MTFNLFSKGVLSSSDALSIVPLIIPFWECSPIAIAMHVPVPSITFVPLSNIIELGSFSSFWYSSKQFSYEFFFTAFDSPVKALSSIFRPLASITNISAGNISP